ncbi:MAG TPA: hypothetical protein EYP04_13290 [Anaerolineae bacterium]|nr:hypothetical protein [Anaerolineae bacterium]
MTLTQGMHYARIEHWRRAAVRYRVETGCNYFDDLYQVHADLGLAFQWQGVRVVSHLTPAKERETLLMGEFRPQGAGGVAPALKSAIYRTLRCFLDRLGVLSFNVALYMPPIAGPANGEDWSDFPVIARLVDWGNPLNQTGDIGAMELYAANVIGTDPFFVADQLRQEFDIRAANAIGEYEERML